MYSSGTIKYSDIQILFSNIHIYVWQKIEKNPLRNNNVEYSLRTEIIAIATAAV